MEDDLESMGIKPPTWKKLAIAECDICHFSFAVMYECSTPDGSDIEYIKCPECGFAITQVDPPPIDHEKEQQAEEEFERGWNEFLREHGVIGTLLRRIRCFFKGHCKMCGIMNNQAIETCTICRKVWKSNALDRA